MSNAEKLIQARTHFKAREFALAERLAREVRDADPTLNDAEILLGQIAFQAHRYEPSIKHFTKAVAAEPDRAEVHAMLGAVQLVHGVLDGALASFRRAVELEPEDGEYIAGVAETHERRGERDDAIALVEARVGRGDAPPRMALTLARSLLAARRFDDAVTVCDGALAGVMPNTFRRSLQFVLGHAHHGLERYEAAWRAWQTANAVEAPAFAPQSLIQRHIELRELFGRDAPRRPAQATTHSRLPVFVIGMPRCGSTLVEQIIHAHPKGFGAGETSDVATFTRRLPRLLGRPGNSPAVLAGAPLNIMNQLSKRLLDRIRSYDAKASRIVDKSLENTETLGLIDRLLPKAKVVHVLRDPMDVCFSCYIHDLWPEAHPHTSRLEDLGYYYRAQQSLMDFWKENLDLDVLELHYEELIADQEAQTRRLIEFIGLPWSDQCMRYFEVKRNVATVSYDQVRQPIYKGAAGRYQHYVEHLEPLRKALGVDK